MAVTSVTPPALTADDDAFLAALGRTWRAARSFPSPQLVDAAAGMLPSLVDPGRYLPVGYGGGRKRSLPRLRTTTTVGPGLVALKVTDTERRDRFDPSLPLRGSGVRRPWETDLRTIFDCEARDLNLEAATDAYWVERFERVASGEDEPMAYGVRATITEWSRRSRTRLVRAIAELDFSKLMAGDPCAMVTLTYARDWLSAAPNGKATKQHLRLFQLAWRRRWGSSLVGVWKLEFQRRGAPHVHILTVPPRSKHFRAWLSQTWADIVDHQDPVDRARHLLAGTAVDYAEGARCRDPRRCAVYFLKHSSKTVDSKEYQHIVPEAWRELGQGPGRFWGYWGLRKSTVTLELDPADFVSVRRVLRRWGEANGRRVFRRPGLVGGFIVFNDGPAVVAQLAMWLESRRAYRVLTARQQRLARLLLERDKAARDRDRASRQLWNPPVWRQTGA